ncbi:MAG: ClbS/DfsB family four-helix bundle protein [Anaerolineales bacterium]|nr:ClbS/DfsB family four-helix bundle protein [Anaerolineales bacterium]
MPRPLNKSQLLEVCLAEYSKLDEFLAALSPGQMDTPSTAHSWSVKDILAHLYEWQQMVFCWYQTSLQGGAPAVPAAGLNWGQIPELNQRIYKHYRDRSLVEILELFRDSHSTMVSFIEEASDEALTTPGLYPWMNKNTLLAYLNSASGSHYRWALREIKKMVKNL